MKYSEKHLHERSMKEVKKFRELRKEFVVCTNLLELLRLWRLYWARHIAWMEINLYTSLGEKYSGT